MCVCVCGGGSRHNRVSPPNGNLGAAPARWTAKWEKGASLSAAFKNSFTCCRIPLWPESRTGAAGQCRAPFCACWPSSSYQADPAQRLIGSPVRWMPDSSSVKVFWPLILLLLLPSTCFHLPQHHRRAPCKRSRLSGVPETPLLLRDTITVQCAGLKASVERIKAS